MDNKQRRYFLKQILRKIFLEDWLLKLISLVIAFTLWFGVTGLSTPTTSRFSGIPLTLRISNNAEVINSPIQEVDIVVSGDKRKVAQINKNDLVASLDLTEVPAGDRVIQLTPDNVSIELPNGIKLDEIQPGRIAVKLEAVEEKDIVVRATTEGSPAEGFEIYSETISPAKVRVRGPASFINSLSFIPTEKIDLSGRSEDFTVKQIALNISNPKATIFDTVVDIAIRIGEKRVERAFFLSVKSENPRKATVVLYGPRTLLAKAAPADLQVQLYKNENGEDVPHLTLPPHLQENVEVRKLKLQ